MWAEKSVLIENLLPKRTAFAAVDETGDRVKLERLERENFQLREHVVTLRREVVSEVQVELSNNMTNEVSSDDDEHTDTCDSSRVDSCRTSLQNELKKSPAKYRACTFWLMLSWPIFMISLFLVICVHDLVCSVAFPNYVRDHLDPTLATCWQNTTGSLWTPATDLLPLWSGNINAWAARGSGGPCDHIFLPTGLWIYIIVLPWGWFLTVRASIRARHVCAKKQKMMMLTNKMLRAGTRKEHGKEVSHRLVDDFLKSTQRIIWKHAVYVILFQLSMLVFDSIFSGFTTAWCVLYQMFWFGFGASLLQVRPVVMFAVKLSQTMVDEFIWEIEAGRTYCIERQHRPLSWVQLATQHHRLERELSDLWRDVNLLAFFPGVPFLIFGFLHFLGDTSLFHAVFLGAYCWMSAGIFHICCLSPIASVSSMFNTSAAFKAPDPTKHARSIHAVVRRFANEVRTQKEQQEYNMMLQYVATHKISVYIGIPKIVMARVDRSHIESMFYTVTFKLPTFLALLFAVRKYFVY